MHRAADGTIYLKDLNRCVPGTAVSELRTKHAWKAWRYETTEFAGRMLVLGEETAPPDIRYPLDLDGWYSIWLGMYTRSGPTGARVRLSGEASFLHVGYKHERNFVSRVEDVFWRHADLTGQDIIFRRGDAGLPAYIAYVKLVPLAADEVATVEADRADAGAKRLIAHHDASGLYFAVEDITAADIREYVEPYRHTDFGRLTYEFAMGDVCAYATETGRTWASFLADGEGGRVIDRHASENWASLAAQGIDPPKLAVEYVREMGLEFHAAYRLNMGFMDMTPMEERSLDGPFYTHPEWRCIDRDGRDVGRLSYAFPGVRRLVLSILREIAEYDIDGLCLLHNRQPPHVMYEAPLVEGFEAETGLDPRTLDERDGRWLRYRCAALTTFMREVRAAMDEIGARKGKRVPISAWVMGSEAENVFYGLDLETWVAEGLVDMLIPDNSVTKSGGRWNLEDIAWFVDLTRETSCELAVSVMPRQQPPEEFRRYALELYRAGVPKLAFWDTDSRNDLGRSWTAIRRLGHEDELAAWERAGEPSLAPSEMVITRLGDYNMVTRERLSIMTDYSAVEPDG